MATLGHLALAAAVLAAAVAILASTAAARFGSLRFLRVGKACIGLVALAFTVASGALVVALMRSDFSIDYVGSYTERALPAGYKIAAFWAGQEGSLLLWAWFLGVMSLVGALGLRRLTHIERSVTVAALGLVGGFFAAMLLFAADPFAAVGGMVPPDGRGLNPMLQNPGMIAHPPLLFLGYAGFTVPFAVLIGVLVPGRRDNRWIAEIRRWMLVTWVFLTAGIVLGAWWAYVELGWGGYWAWDPVENASLLPWLTATGALHSIMVQQHRGMFKVWNACLIAITFILCIFGTYLTRSGVIDSVHSFAPSPIGRFFLVFLGVLTLGSAGLILWRLPRLKAEHRLEGMLSREAVFLYGNLLLTVMMLTTLVGTVFPILSRVVGSDPITVGQPFYNRVVAPMGVLLVGLMALGPVLASGGTMAGRFARSLVLPSLFALAGTVVVAIAGGRNLWVLICTFIALLGTFAVILGFLRAVSARHRSTGESWPLAALHLVDRDHRRYGGQIAHLGLMLIVVGVAGSSIFAHEQVFRLQPGQTASIDRYEITYVGLEQVREVNFTAVQATVQASQGDSEAITLHPQTRFYDAWGNEPNTEVAIRSGWRDDLYVSLAGWESGGTIAAIEVRVNPLVLWIWLGGIVAVIGGTFAILPPLVRPARRAMEPVPEQVPGEKTAAGVPVGTAARVALEEAH